MFSETAHNFYRPWYYTMLDLERKSIRGKAKTGAYVIDDLLYAFNMAKKNIDSGNLIEKTAQIVKLFSDYSKSVKNNIEELKNTQNHILNEIEAMLLSQENILTELQSELNNTNSSGQGCISEALLDSLADTVCQMTEKLLNGYFSQPSVFHEAQCPRCNFINAPLTLICVSCAKVFTLGQNEMMTEMILNLSLHEENQYQSDFLTNNKVADFFFKYLMFLNEQTSMENLIKELDILELVISKTKIKAEKALYTTVQTEPLNEYSQEGYDFIEGLNKISAKLASVRDSLYAVKPKDPQVLWTEIIDGMRILRRTSHFYFFIDTEKNSA